jgi:hypothetical protein
MAFVRVAGTMARLSRFRGANHHRPVWCDFPFAHEIGSNRSMRPLALLAMVVLTVTCGPSPNAQLPGYAMSTGGSNPPAAGGTTAVGTGGTTGAGGSSVVGAGGRPGTGGATVGSGGRTGSGGATATGGRSGTGGNASGTGGSTVGSGGTTTGSGGKTTGSGGTVSGGTTTGTGGGGGAATGGSTGTRDAAIPPAGTCISQVVINGYACGSTPACSVCKDQNGNSRESGCKKAIDCLAAAGANCDSNCKQNCLNQAGDSPAMACVSALQTAACSGSGCGTMLPPNGGG